VRWSTRGRSTPRSTCSTCRAASCHARFGRRLRGSARIALGRRGQQGDPAPPPSTCCGSASGRSANLAVRPDSLNDRRRTPNIILSVRGDPRNVILATLVRFGPATVSLGTTMAATIRATRPQDSFWGNRPRGSDRLPHAPSNLLTGNWTSAPSSPAAPTSRGWTPAQDPGRAIVQHAVLAALIGAGVGYAIAAARRGKRSEPGG